MSNLSFLLFTSIVFQQWVATTNTIRQLATEVGDNVLLMEFIQAWRWNVCHPHSRADAFLSQGKKPLAIKIQQFCVFIKKTKNLEITAEEATNNQINQKHKSCATTWQSSLSLIRNHALKVCLTVVPNTRFPSLSLKNVVSHLRLELKAYMLTTSYWLPNGRLDTKKWNYNI